VGNESPSKDVNGIGVDVVAGVPVPVPVLNCPDVAIEDTYAEEEGVPDAPAKLALALTESVLITLKDRQQGRHIHYQPSLRGAREHDRLPPCRWHSSDHGSRPSTVFREYSERYFERYHHVRRHLRPRICRRKRDRLSQ
jgi:hypothetical protein